MNGISVRYPYREERLNDLADEWLAGNYEACLEAQRLHSEEVRDRIQKCIVVKRVSRRWKSAPAILDVLRLRNQGFTLNEIGTKLNISKRTICRILKKQSTIQTTVLPQREAFPMP